MLWSLEPRAIHTTTMTYVKTGPECIFLGSFHIAEQFFQTQLMSWFPSGKCHGSLIWNDPFLCTPKIALWRGDTACTFTIILRSSYELDDVPDASVVAGTPCNNYGGYCDVYKKCRSVSNARDYMYRYRLVIFLFSLLKKWIYAANCKHPPPGKWLFFFQTGF